MSVETIYLLDALCAMQMLCNMINMQICPLIFSVYEVWRAKVNKFSSGHINFFCRIACVDILVLVTCVTQYMHVRVRLSVM